MTRHIRWILAFGVALVLVGCTTGAAPTATSSSVPSTTVTAAPTTSSLPPETEGVSGAFDPDSISWSRQVVMPSGSASLDGWYRDISPHPIGFMAAGAQMDGLAEKPMAWLSPQGLNWMPIAIPAHLEGRFTALANNGEVTVLVGYDTSRQAGLVVRVPRGSDPLEVEFDDPVEFRDILATDLGFVAYGLAEPTQDAQATVYTSADGSSWKRQNALPFGPVVEAVVGAEGSLLEIPDPGFGQTVRIRHAPSLFDEDLGSADSWDISLAADAEGSFPYAMTGMATESGFLIGGGEALSGRPTLWEVDLPVGQGPLTARVVAFEAPADSRLNGRLIDIRHLTRAGEKVFAVVAALNGPVEAWSTSDLATWVVEEKIGVDPSSPRYASAQSFTGNLPSVPDPGVARTLVVTNGGFPADVWAFGDEVLEWSDNDLLAYQQPATPLFIGAGDDHNFARVVEHGPRWSQTEPDLVRTRMFSLQETNWVEVAATAWDNATRIQSVVELGSATIALGTSTDRRAGIVNQIFPIADAGLGEALLLDSPVNGLELFSGAATDRVAAVVGVDTRADGDRIVVWASTDLATWEYRWIEETAQSFIGAVCAGLDRIWVVGRRGGGYFSSARAWSSIDGATWASSTPVLPGSETPKDFTACAGDENRVVGAATSPEGAFLMITTDALTWESTPQPPALLLGDRIVEVAVDGDRIGIIVEHPQDYFRPRSNAWLWDGAVWHHLVPEPDVEIGSIVLTDGTVYLAGISLEGPTVWESSEA